MNATLQSLPILVLYPHNRCNCRCVMCDIWKDSSRSEISCAELRRHLDDFVRLGVEWVVLSGGEPLMHSDLFRFCGLLKERGIRITLLSTGLLLERHARPIVESIDDVIVSLDGPAKIHDQIRRIQGAFSMLARGVEALHEIRPDFPVSARSTIQCANHFCLSKTASAAREMGLRSISFLAADLSSEAFNRPGGWSRERQDRIALNADEIPVLEREIDELDRVWAGTGFVMERREKLNRIALHFRSHLQLANPVAPRCNAPWVSAVVEADGTVRPCFFHKPIGRLSEARLPDILNGLEAQLFRMNLDIATNPICQRCVCSLNWSEGRIPTTKIAERPEGTVRV